MKTTSTPLWYWREASNFLTIDTMDKVIIGIAGESGSGKDTMTRYLIERYGASHHKFSSVLRDVLDRLGIEQSRGNIDTVSTTLRRAFGDDLLSRVVCRDIGRDAGALVVMDGVRRESDLMCVRNMPGFRLVFVETSPETRYRRITGRRENTDDAAKTFEEFLKETRAEPQLRVRGLKDIADYLVRNDGTLEDLYAQVDKVMTDLKA
jgi:dephospho-CoA kinase